jgi:hypothetical protein
MRHCQITDYEKYTTFACHHEPTYLLIHSCTRPSAPGCNCRKVDASINFLVHTRAKQLADTDHVLFTDDQTYWRPDQLLRWLAAVQRSGVDKFPTIATAEPEHQPQQVEPPSHSNWLFGPSAKCVVSQPDGTGYQHALLNYALLVQVVNATAAFTVPDTCRNQGTSYNTALQMLAAQYQAYHLTIPGINLNTLHRGVAILSPTDLAVQHVLHAPKEHCDSAQDNGWRPQDRIKQNIAIGCGDIGQPSPRHNKLDGATMYDTWEFFQVHGRDLPFGVAGVNGFVEVYVVVERQSRLTQVLGESSSWSAYLSLELARWAGLARVITGDCYRMRHGDSVEKRVVPRLEPLHTRTQTSKIWSMFSSRDCSV